jgi:hypothetical protein
MTASTVSYGALAANIRRLEVDVESVRLKQAHVCVETIFIQTLRCQCLSRFWFDLLPCFMNAALRWGELKDCNHAFT